MTPMLRPSESLGSDVGAAGRQPSHTVTINGGGREETLESRRREIPESAQRCLLQLESACFLSEVAGNRP